VVIAVKVQSSDKTNAFATLNIQCSNVCEIYRKKFLLFKCMEQFLIIQLTVDRF